MWGLWKFAAVIHVLRNRKKHKQLYQLTVANRHALTIRHQYEKSNAPLDLTLSDLKSSNSRPLNFQRLTSHYTGTQFKNTLLLNINRKSYSSPSRIPRLRNLARNFNLSTELHGIFRSGMWKLQKSQLYMAIMEKFLLPEIFHFLSPEFPVLIVEFPFLEHRISIFWAQNSGGVCLEHHCSLLSAECALSDHRISICVQNSGGLFRAVLGGKIGIFWVHDFYFWAQNFKFLAWNLHFLSANFYFQSAKFWRVWYREPNCTSIQSGDHAKGHLKVKVNPS